MWANPSWTNVPRHTTNFRSENFHLTHLFWTLPEQLSMLHHACEPTHPEPTSQDTLQTSDPKIFISHIPILNFAGTDYTSHVCQPWTNVPKIHHKTSDPKMFISHIRVLKFAGAARHITPRMCANPEPTFQRYTTTPQTVRFSSHTSVLNFAGAALHVTPRMWANPSWTNVPRHTTNFRSENVHLTHPCFELCRNNPEQITPRMCQPEPTSQRHTTKPQTLRCSSHTSVLNFAGTALHVTPRMWANPSWTNVPRHTTNFRSENFHLTHPCFEFCRNRLHLTCVPTRNQCSKDTPQNLRPQDVHLTHPCFELCRSSSLFTPRMCANPEPTFQRYTTKPQSVRFSSHTSVSNFAGAALHVTPRMWATPSWTNVPRHTTNFRSENFHLTHPCFELCQNRLHACVPTLNQRSKHTPQNLRPKDFHLTHPSFELCRSSSPYYTTHVGQPIVNQRPKRHYKLQIRILSSHTSVLNFAGTAPHVAPHMWANPSWTNVPRHTTKPQTPRFSSHTSISWTLPEQLSILHHTCEPTHPEPTSQDTLQTSDPIFFISLIPVLNFAGIARHVTPRMWANPSCTNVPRYTTNH